VADQQTRIGPIPLRPDNPRTTKVHGLPDTAARHRRTPGALTDDTPKEATHLHRGRTPEHPGGGRISDPQAALGDQPDRLVQGGQNQELDSLPFCESEAESNFRGAPFRTSGSACVGIKNRRRWTVRVECSVSPEFNESATTPQYLKLDGTWSGNMGAIGGIKVDRSARRGIAGEVNGPPIRVQAAGSAGTMAVDAPIDRPGQSQS